MTGLMMSLLLAAPAPRQDGAQLLNQLRKLQVLGTALYVAAHPDDENTRLLASLANETKYRAAYLSFTRGEGGQNLIGAELGPLLGTIRTQELLAARRLDGAEQYFTRARDFGFSKSVDETLAIWNHDAVLADAVRVIRALRPDVIITRFRLEAGGTHGHHTASARLALEAFKAAADPKYHPEWPTWQAKRIVWNTWSPERLPKVPDGSVTWDSSLYNPLLGVSWGELAAESRSQHKSQGFGAAPIHEGSPEYFAPLGGEAARQSLFDGIDTSWKRVPGSEAVATALAEAEAGFRVDAPARSIPTLLKALTAMRRLPDGPWKTQKVAALEELVAGCAGLFLEANAKDWRSSPGAEVTLDVFALNRSDAALKLESVTVRGVTVKPAAALARGTPTRLEVRVTSPGRESSPYWLDLPPEKGAWAVPPGDDSTAPELPSPFAVEYRLSSGGEAFTLTRPAYFKWTDPTMGERYRPIEVLPKVVASVDDALLAFTDAKARAVTVTLEAGADGQTGTLGLELPEGYAATPATHAYSLVKRGDRASFAFQLKAGAKASPTGVITLTADGTPLRTLTRIDYPHIPMQTVLLPAQVKAMRLALARGKTRKVGYIVGAGDDVPAALSRVGYQVTVLDEEALRGPLGGYDAIVVGIRAYNVHPWLARAYGPLMQYVKGGGVLVAQYNTRNWLSEVPAEIGPWPFEISHDRVTDEEAAVTREKHAVFQTPNALTDADFDGWVQERGLYFASTWDARYQTPITMKDPGEQPSRGSLLIAPYGRGRFVYTGLAFFRQLPAGVPGAYRLFANVIARGN